MHTQQIPNTRRGRTLRAFLAVLGITSLVGLVNSIHSLAWIALTSGVGSAQPGMKLVRTIFLFAGWSLLGYAAYQGVRNNRAPSTWLILSAPVLVWIGVALIYML